MLQKKRVYNFGNGLADGTAKLKNLLGGKGANLAEMSRIGLPVPPGFTITTDICTDFYKNNCQYPEGLSRDVDQSLNNIGKMVGSVFGDTNNPLLVSVRSGSRASMPGMMDTVLNLGLNDVTVEGLAKKTGDTRFAWDSYRRFIQMYSDVVLGVRHDHFEDILDHHKLRKGYMNDTDLTAEDWQELVDLYQTCVSEKLNRSFPQNVMEQLWGAIGAVFGSWHNTRAEIYRRLNNIPEDWGTAVNVQAMVFGNLGNHSATGVAFTRNPSTGENVFYGEFLVNAQGEDVVSGIRTPQSLTRSARLESGQEALSMEEIMPDIFGQLVTIFRNLEKHYRDMQDIEFTVQENKLWVLQTRSGKRTTQAALKIAVDMVAEGVIYEEEAVLRIDPLSLEQLLHPRLDPHAPCEVIAKGLPASPGSASGEVVFTALAAETAHAEGRKIILVRMETSPEDIHGMHIAQGILTSRGGMTSHAAVVARGMGRPCVSGANDIYINYDKQELTVLEHKIKGGDVITIDGSTGSVMLGKVPSLQPTLSDDFAQLMQWADKHRRMRVRSNAETPEDARTALKFGAEGIGLCRTEHMFFEADRIMIVREMIISETKEGRAQALEKILLIQRQDFIELFRIMAGLPVTVRLLDPPLHEFLPHHDSDVADAAQAMGVGVASLTRRIKELNEMNPMLGHRGCRLGVSYPEIYEMQVRAIFEAAITLITEEVEPVHLEIMIPLVFGKSELQLLVPRMQAIGEQVQQEKGQKIDCLMGTMIELPRAALRAGDIAESVEFFSFGTNDLTQTTFGISRDDATLFLRDYIEQGLLACDPFVHLDQEGVGELIKIAIERGKKTRADIKLGICGEHGGDPSSIVFCESVNMDYVSCSPYRVPIARLAAAHARLRDLKV